MFPAMTKEGSRPRYVGAKDLRALIDAEPESVEGKRVPLEPTDEMIHKGTMALLQSTSSELDGLNHKMLLKYEEEVERTYKAMLCVAPSAAPQDNLIAELVEALNVLLTDIDAIRCFETDKGKYEGEDYLRELLKRAKEILK